jgi:ketosteroid isomerase-like protein
MSHTRPQLHSRNAGTRNFTALHLHILCAPQRLATFLATLLLLTLATALHAQATPTDATPADQLRTLTRDELDVVKVLTHQEDAWNKGNLDAFAAAYKDSPDVLFIGSHISHGFADVLTEYKQNYPTKDSMGTLSFTELEPRILDDRYAILAGHYKLERSKKAGGNSDGYFSLVLEKTKEGWKILVDHTS